MTKEKCDEECYLFRTNTCQAESPDGMCDREHKPKDQYDDAGNRIFKHLTK